MTNKIAKVTIKIIIMALIFQIITTPAVSAKGFWTEIFQSGKEFIGSGKGEVRENPTINEDDVNALNSKIYYGLMALGVCLAVIIGTILGIQIMWGSIELQVKAKEMLMPYAIGCIVIFGAFGIWKLCISLFAKI